MRVQLINPASVATDWWTTTNDPQPESVLERMMTPDDIAQMIEWMLSRPDHIHISELLVHNARSPW